jgi:hypothetical protein
MPDCMTEGASDISDVLTGIAPICESLCYFDGSSLSSYSGYVYFFLTNFTSPAAMAIDHYGPRFRDIVLEA